MRLLTFRLDGRRFALPAADVQEVVRAVRLAPLPALPGVVEGALDLRGVVVPVFDLRARFALPARALRAADQLVVARAGRRLAAVRVDEAEELVEVDDAAVSPPGDLSPAVRDARGVVALPDGVVAIADLHGFLSDWEERALARALAAAPDGAPTA
jgi:purine-binding chemotaxis protein CheW